MTALRVCSTVSVEILKQIDDLAHGDSISVPGVGMDGYYPDTLLAEALSSALGLACALVLGSWGNTIRGAVRNKEM